MLKKIAIFKALDIEIKKQRGPLAVKESHRGHHSLKEELSQPGITILAEVAGGNPARGQVRENFRPSTHAKSLVENGARALAVATDRFLYFGEDKHLVEVRSQVKVPLLRREFIFEEYQVEESKILGADAITLMPTLLTQERLQALAKLAQTKGLDVVAEVANELDLKRALEASIDIVCVVGRDLDTWEPSWAAALALLAKIPAKKCLRMVEASIATLSQIKELEAMGVHGAIIGDALLDEFYPGKRLAQILSGAEPPRKSAKGKSKAQPTEKASEPVVAKGVSGKKETEKRPVKHEEKAASVAKTSTLKSTTVSSPSNPARKGHKEPPMAQTETNAVPAADTTAAPKKAAAKKAAAKKPAAKKAAPKKAAAKKPAAKKAAAKKPAAKKAAAKKPAAKKAAPKKAAAKKAAPKKAAAKKAAPKKAAAKKAAPKKAAAKKAAPKKAAAKKAAPKKAAAKKPAAKKAMAKKK